MEDTDKLLQETIYKILGDYCDTYGYSPFAISLVISQNIWDTYFGIRPDLKAYRNEQMPAFNGTMVPPANLDGVFTIILDGAYLYKDLQNKQYTWVGTIVHEATHARDYMQYAQLINAGNYDEIVIAKDHRLFHIWTEFNARRHGHYFVRKYSYEDMHDPVVIDYTVEQEMPFHIDYMVKEYNSTTDGWQQIYAITQLLGRLSVWKELYPEIFNDFLVKGIFNQNDWMYDMFIWLDEHRYLNEAFQSFNGLQKAISRNFTWFH